MNTTILQSTVETFKSHLYNSFIESIESDMHRLTINKPNRRLQERRWFRFVHRYEHRRASSGLPSPRKTRGSLLHKNKTKQHTYIINHRRTLPIRNQTKVVVVSPRWTASMLGLRRSGEARSAEGIRGRCFGSAPLRSEVGRQGCWLSRGFLLLHKGKMKEGASSS